VPRLGRSWDTAGRFLAASADGARAGGQRGRSRSSWAGEAAASCAAYAVDDSRDSAGSLWLLHALVATALDVARGMQHLHALGFVHMDLKAENVLLTSCPGDPLRGFTAKVADFGLSVQLGKQADGRDGESSGSSQLLGSAVCLAPEAIAGRVCQASDVWWVRRPLPSTR
jgi:hypothetical protein